MPMADLGGLGLQYRLEGDPSGAPVVLIHALGTDLDLFEPALPHLPKGLKVLRFSLRGHGLSDIPPPPYGMGALVRDTEALMDHLGLREAVVVGVSIGGMVAQGLAVKRLDLVEAEADALACARVNITDDRAQFHWADATTFRPDTLLDAVVMNPPFHHGRDADPGLGAAFIQAARRMLAPNGALWLVANRHLPYDAALTAAFLEHREVAGDSAFRVIHAIKPIRAKP
jgi:pimeloyl-ACP methyl ester carboxylesterase